MTDKIRREELAYVFDLGLDLDVWVHAKGEVLDRPMHACITRCRFTPRGPLVRHPRLLVWILQRRRRTFFIIIKISKFKKRRHIRRTNKDR